MTKVWKKKLLIIVARAVERIRVIGSLIEDDRPLMLACIILMQKCIKEASSIVSNSPEVEMRELTLEYANTGFVFSGVKYKNKKCITLFSV